jgi:dehydrogenase/reductase SDR family protein 7
MLPLVLVITFLGAFLYWFARLDCDATTWLYSKIGRSGECMKGQVIWVVGASSGIGASLAEQLAACGAKLVISGTKTNNLYTVKQKCLNQNSKLTSDDVLVLPFDISDIEGHKRRYDQVIEQFGHLDILVNNAGRACLEMFEDTSSELDRELFGINVFGVIALTRLVVKDWYATKRPGYITVTSSIAGKQGTPVSAAYAASKHALHGYFESLRVESFRKGLKISMMCPGPVKTDIMFNAYTERADAKTGVIDTKGFPMMTSDRCAELMVTAMANGIDESWQCVQPILIFVYMAQYWPSVARWLMSRLVTEKMMRSIKTGED